MKRIVLISCFIAFVYTATAQTKRIAYRSHSGNNAVFALLEEDNLGVPFGFEKGWWKIGEIIKDSLAKYDSTLVLDIADTTIVTKKQAVKADTILPIKHLPGDALQTKPKPEKINNKKGEVINGGEANKKQGSFPLMLLVGLLIPTGFATAYALRQ